MADEYLRTNPRGETFSSPSVTDSVTFDVSQLVELAEDLRGAGARLSLQIPRIIKRGANNIKVDARRRYRASAGKHGRGHAWRYPSAIDYDIDFVGTEVIALIGPDKHKAQGALGNLIEFGSANNAPLPHLIPAFNTEVPKTAAQIQIAALKAVFPT